MKKDQKINLDEETTNVEQIAASTPKIANTKKSGAWKSVLIGGVPGVILGTAGTAFAQEVIDVPHQDNQSEEAPDTNADHVEPQEVGVEMAESVNDDMSFGEAFAAAREEVGPGGVFEWHGNLYNTYSAAEWEAMSDEDRQEFANNVYNASNNEENPEEGEQGQDLAELENNDNGESGVEQEPATNEVIAEGDTEPADPTDIEATSEEEAGNEVIDVQVHEVGSVATEDGEIMNVAVATVDGHDAAFVDVDNDGYVDGVLVDANDDGVIEDNEVIETPDSDVDMSYLAMMTEGPEDSMYDGTPDYTNDADTSSLA